MNRAVCAAFCFHIAARSTQSPATAMAAAARPSTAHRSAAGGWSGQYPSATPATSTHANRTVPAARRRAHRRTDRRSNRTSSSCLKMSLVPEYRGKVVIKTDSGSDCIAEAIRATHILPHISAIRQARSSRKRLVCQRSGDIDVSRLGTYNNTVIHAHLLLDSEEHSCDACSAPWVIVFLRSAFVCHERADEGLSFLVTICLLIAATAGPGRAATFESTGLYHSYNELAGWAYDLQAQNPDLVNVVQYGTSVQGRALLAINITTDPLVNNPAKPEFLFTAGIHAREVITSEAALALAETLIDGYRSGDLPGHALDARRVDHSRPEPRRSNGRGGRAKQFSARTCTCTRPRTRQPPRAAWT